MMRVTPAVVIIAALLSACVSSQPRDPNTPTRNVVEMEYGSKVDPSAAAQQIADTAAKCWTTRDTPFRGFRVAGLEQTKDGKGYWVNFADDGRITPTRVLRLFIVNDRDALIAGVEQLGVPEAEPFVRRELSGLAKGRIVACR